MQIARGVLAVLVLSLTACAGNPADNANFEYDGGPGPHPWLHESFDAAPEQFTFGIVSDLTGGEREGIFNIAVAQLNLLRPEFVISVGDLIEGDSTDPVVLKAEWDDFDRRAGKLTAPFFHVGGNHDLTGMPLREIWEARFGERYYWFRYRDVLFLVLDSEDHSAEKMAEMFVARKEAIRLFEAGRDAEAHATKYMTMPERVSGWVGQEQVDYFRDVLAANEDVRWTFVFAHKPVWLREGDKPFDALEAALADRPYTWFNGHVHAYRHAPRLGRDYMVLGTTGGIQDVKDSASFDHVTLVTVTADGPSVANLRLDGILDKTGQIPLDGAGTCFQASACGR